MITSSRFLKYSMTNSSGSSQCAIPDIFKTCKQTNPSYQAIGSERQIFSMSVIFCGILYLGTGFVLRVPFCKPRE